MQLKSIGTLLVAALCLAGCDNEGKSMGNGPGNADGAGGRADSPAVDEAPKPSSTTDPAGAMTTPDGSTEDTGATPRDPAPANH